MDLNLCKTFKLYNTIQNYAWGSKNEEAFIPKLLNESVEQDLPYAELWIGAHPKASSRVLIDGEFIPLCNLIEDNNKEILGEYVSKKFGGQFPFLLKVLSAAEALSIQTHPNKKQAEELHSRDPKNYPDNNHKPEIAIAVDSLKALAGFKPCDEIVRNLKSLPELASLIGIELYSKINVDMDQSDTKKLIKEIYTALMVNSSDRESLKSLIGDIHTRLTRQLNRTIEENEFIIQHKNYGSDVGLLSFFFFNLIELNERAAIFTDSGVPHAYIKGNIIECMANSDNVVRAGLTAKFKDVDTLLKIINYQFQKYNIINRERLDDEVIYKTSAEEFEISLFNKNDFSKKCFSNNKPSVILIMRGSMRVSYQSNEANIEDHYSNGESFLIPACLKEYRIDTESCCYFVASVP